MIDADDLDEVLRTAVFDPPSRAGQPPSDRAWEAAIARLRQELRRFLDNVPDELTVRDLREALQPNPRT